MRNELARSKVTTQDQTSVPVEVRRRFGIKSGCELGWYEEDGRLYVDLARTHTLADVRAALKNKRASAPKVDIKEAIKSHVAEKFKRACR
jgi:bifunctional DNA-binding transcriptional regulator/antitoxin component of YhaV-PrlF toxin-antitoxin module